MAEAKVMTVTELELKILVLQKKREGQHLERAELNRLCRAIWRHRRALKREKHLTKIKEKCGDGKASKKSRSKHLNWSSIAKQKKSEISSHRLLPRPLYNPCGPKRHCSIRENSLDEAVEKLENGLCGWNADLNEEVEECAEQPGSDHSGCFESIAPEVSGKVGEIVVCDVLGYELPGGMVCSLTVVAPKVVGAACLTKFRPIANLCAMRKVLGYVWLAQVSPSIAV